MKRILEMFGEPITYGGQESVVFNMLSSLNLKEDYNINLYTPYYADNEKLIGLVENNKGQVYHDDIEFKLNDNRFRLNSIVDSFFKTHNKYDVVHIHTGSLTTMYVYAKNAKKYGIKKVIVHSHTTGFKVSLSMRIRRLILNMLLKRYVDVYFACSEDAANFKFGNYYSSKPIIVYNGIDINIFKFNNAYRDEIRNKYNIGNKYLIGSLGRLSFEKNNFFLLDILNKVFKVNENAVLMIAGNGEYYEPLQQKCKELKLDNNVIFTGSVLDAYKYYSAFDIFLMPSFYEGMPVTAIEAQISGLQCLISDTVTRECNISDITTFISISNIKLWVDSIVKSMNEFNVNTVDKNRMNVNVDFNKFDRRRTFKIVESVYTD